MYSIVSNHSHSFLLLVLLLGLCETGKRGRVAYIWRRRRAIAQATDDRTDSGVRRGNGDAATPARRDVCLGSGRGCVVDSYGRGWSLIGGRGIPFGVVGFWRIGICCNLGIIFILLVLV